MKLDITVLDAQLLWLKREAQNLRTSQRGDWVETKARMLDAIHETLRKVRQEQQMTGMSGRRLDE